MINQRQRQFLEKVKRYADMMDELYADSFTLSQSFAEEFSTGKENSMNPVDAKMNDADYLDYGLNFSGIKQAMEKPAAEFVKFYTNQAVTTAEYGKFLRRIMNIQ